MKIGLIDNDLVSRENHSFPNLAIMKLSGYHKNLGDDVNLIGFNEINPGLLFHQDYDLIYVSKAFKDSHTPSFIFKMSNVKIGGTGFYFDKSAPLPFAVEHSMPDYTIYNKILHTIKNKSYYLDYSIGYTTRGCFRHCSFCVNMNSNKVSIHSPVDEFYDSSKKKIAMLDDNILGLPNKELFKIFDRFKEINKPITYRQGLDIRLLTEERINKLFELKYDGEYYFAFDLWKNKDIIESKMKLFHDTFMSKTVAKNRYYIHTKMYLFCGFDETGNYNDLFFLSDIEILFKRIEICIRYKMSPYVMRFEKSFNTEYEKIYLGIIQWTNNIYMPIAKQTFREYFESYNLKNIKSFFDKQKHLWRYLELKL